MNRVRVINGKRVYEPDPAMKPRARATPKPASRGPGTLVKAVLNRLGIHPQTGCECREFQEKMDAWGWGGCLSHGLTIIRWFSKKAKQYDVKVTPRLIWAAILAAYQELRPAGGGE